MTHEMTIKDIEPVDVIGVTFKTSPESISQDGAQAMKDLLEGLHRDDITPSGPLALFITLWLKTPGRSKRASR